MVTVKLIGVFITNTLTENLQKLRPELPYLVGILSNNGQRYASVLVTEDSGTEIFYTLGRSEKGLTPQSRIDPVNASLGVCLSISDGTTTYSIATNSLDINFLARKAREFSSQVDVGIGIPHELVEDSYLDKHWVTETVLDPTKTDKNVVIGILQRLAEKMINTDVRIVNARTYHDSRAKHKLFSDNYKTLSQTLYSCSVGLIPTARDDDQRIAFRIIQAPGYEVLADLPEDIANELGEEVLLHLGARKIEPGEYRVILGPRAAGLVAHESFGHGFEADRIVVNSARGGDFIGKRVGSDLVIIRDFPGIPGKNGSYFFDDQGVVVEGPTTMVQNGILNEQPLTDMNSFLKLSKRLNVRRSPNGRVETYDHPVYPRMSNTYFDTDSRGINFDEMCERVDNGVYLDQGYSGMEDPLGWGIQLTFLRGWKIRDGKVTRECFYMPAGTGNVPDLLQSIDMIGDSLEIGGSARCGKGHKEFVRVSSGGTYISGKLVLA
ncbi:MAG: TldD/PmbA family protein [Candidatus Aenigmarchaeota archaeon]|nr:TldD/PmbA family protein [Candidatus Aenigmarchaeota archaeon]